MMDPMALVVALTCARAVTRLTDALAARWVLAARVELARLRQAALEEPPAGAPGGRR